jgi:hypothetical protein
MTFVTLLHPEETFTIPILQAMTKCRLFENNPTLTVSPYRVQSSVSLSIFREFLSALEGNTMNITDTNLTELQRLCKEFGFEEFEAKFSEFIKMSKDSQGPQIESSLAGMRSAQLRESFEFFVNG